MEKSNHSVKLKDSQVVLIEKLAGLHKELPPASSKVWALLFVSDDPELTFDQIKDTLSLSKGATSQAINHLLLTKRIEAVSHLQDRKRYFRSRVSSWKTDIEEVFDGLGILIDIQQEILDQRPAKTAAFNKDMEEMIKFMAYIRGELLAAFKRYTKKG